MKDSYSSAWHTARRLATRLDDEVSLWREEPMKAIAVRHRLIEPWRRLQYHAFGARSIVDRPIWAYGRRYMSIGERTVILRGAWLSVERPAWKEGTAALRIGNGVWIRPYASISASESIELGDDVVLGTMVSITDSNHTRESGHPNVLYNPLAAKPIRIGRATWIGDRCAILAGADIGVGCVIGANSVVRGVIPDHSVAAGAPAKVVGSFPPPDF